MRRDEHDDVLILCFCEHLFLACMNMMNVHEEARVCVSRLHLIHSSALLHAFVCLWTCTGPSVIGVAN